MSKDKKRETVQTSNKRRGGLHKISSARLVGLFLLALGLVALTFSVIHESSILAFIGLGLTFWGALTLYIAPQEYVKKTLLDPTVIPSLTNLNQMLTELKYEGKPVYLPPKYLKNFETTRIYIPKNKNANLPTPEEIQQKEDKIFHENPEAILLIPSGLSLSKLFEKTLGTTFITTDLTYLQQNLPKLFIEDLEIAENLEIQIKPSKIAKKIINSASITQLKNDIIHIKITNPTYKNIYKENGKLSRKSSTIVNPLYSAIACALTKATGKPITIESIQPSEDNKTIEATYRILETIEPQETEKTQTEITKAIKLRPSHLPKIISLLLIAFGLSTLAWVGWLTWYDMTIHGKELTSIFFSSRAGEAINLGIGMKVIYYLLIGLASLLSGIVTILLKKRRNMYN